MDDQTVMLILTPLEVDVLRGFLGEILATTSNDTLDGIYNALLEEN